MIYLLSHIHLALLSSRMISGAHGSWKMTGGIIKMVELSNPLLGILVHPLLPLGGRQWLRQTVDGMALAIGQWSLLIWLLTQAVKSGQYGNPILTVSRMLWGTMASSWRRGRLRHGWIFTKTASTFGKIPIQRQQESGCYTWGLSARGAKPQCLPESYESLGSFFLDISWLGYCKVPFLSTSSDN